MARDTGKVVQIQVSVRRAGAALLASLIVAAGAALAQADTPGSAAATAPPATELTLASWGGAQARSQRLAVTDRFSAQTGIAVRFLDHNGSLEALRAGARWDLINLLAEEADAGCRAGLLMPLEPALLAPSPDGTPAVEDFFPGLLRECAVGEAVWSLALAYSATALSAQVPRALADVFDPERFPGARAFYRHPRGLLEWALLADGVAPERVYGELLTASGLARAWRRLERIRGQLRWWTRLEQPLRWLRDEEVTFAAVYSDYHLQQAVQERDAYPLLWDGHLWQASYWAIPAGAANPAAARQLLAYASTTAAMAERMRYAAQGPARRSAVQAHGNPLREDLPTWPANLERGLALDVAWWRIHGERLEREFAIWLESGAAAPPGAQEEAVATEAPAPLGPPVTLPEEAVASPVPSADTPPRLPPPLAPGADHRPPKPR